MKVSRTKVLALEMRITVADVSQALASVSKICERGSRVVFDEEGSYIEDKRGGTRTEAHKRNGVYVIDMKVKKGIKRIVQTASKDGEGVFTRPGTDLI